MEKDAECQTFARGLICLAAQGGCESGSAFEEEKVLLSDFELWHFVLNYWYLGESDEEETFEAELAKAGLSGCAARPLPDPKYHAAMEKSWERIFDLDWKAQGNYQLRAQKSIQATFWELRLDAVQAVDEFTAR